MIKEIINRYIALSENNKIVLNNMLAAFIIKGFAVLIAVLLIPAYIRFFKDTTVLGVWLTLNAIMNWFLHFDFGIGNGLRNYLTKALTLQDYRLARYYISSAYFAIFVVCMLFLFIFFFFVQQFDILSLFNIRVNSVADKTILISMFIVFFSVVLQMFFSLSSSMFYSLQKSFANNFLILISSLIMLVSVYLLPKNTDDKNLINLSLISVFANIIPYLIANYIIFNKTKLRECIPSIHYYRKDYAKDILRLGYTFFIVQIAYMLIMTTNEFYISIMCSPEDVVTYQIYYKPFSLISTLFIIALTPIWSAVTKASVENNFVWINRTLKKLICLAIFFSAMTFLSIPFLQLMFDIWLGGGYVNINYAFCMVFAIFDVFLIFNTLMSSISNGLGHLSVQLICYSLGAFLKYPLAQFLVFYFDSWIGVIWANILSLSVYCFVQPCFFKKKFRI